MPNRIILKTEDGRTWTAKEVAAMLGVMPGTVLVAAWNGTMVRGNKCAVCHWE